ncbi:MAG: GNAT family N-acetyltransferase [Bacteroidota bacterium]|nr:GNAT family N-acetyltransferase [Bacteroidota bacterium]
MKLDIRLANKEDAELIADLSRQTFYDSYASQNTQEDMDRFMNEQFTKEALMKEVRTEGNIFLLAFLEQEAVGYARMREGKIRPGFEKPSLEIARIYAVKNKIGKGIGSALMKRCIEIAKEKNKQVIWLAVWKKNQRAIDFYTRWGFEIFGEHDFVLGNDRQTDWLMKKEILSASSA